MFDNIGRVAEQVATSVSRRRFLGSLGGWAAAAALSLAGFLTGEGARGGHELPKCPEYCCTYNNPPFDTCFFIIRVKHCRDCPSSLNGCPFLNCGKNGDGGTPPRCVC